jgi:alkylation response protein AidB-like acyl-CoA dehydrogenase
VARWALERRPGDGASAVADLPTVRVRLGRLDAALRAARIVLLATTRRWDATAPEGRTALLGDIQLAKLQCAAAAVLATDEALRIAGGPGLLAGPLERAFRDARAGLVNPPLEDVAYQGFAAALLDREQASGSGN